MNTHQKRFNILSIIVWTIIISVIIIMLTMSAAYGYIIVKAWFIIIDLDWSNGLQGVMQVLWTGK
ncbi:hypothetical protein BN80_145 [Yersinia phage phiR1-RT]|uniref:Uncharacterized protein n=2 Tax=Tegunavirus TaxID=1921704 RepID=A0A0B5A4I3_9CAUD|nr:hypothetical protein BN80_145 [Yersinia phage phiR1-RT]YP_009200402.1 hypothetical protein AVV33_gp254 [Yersinia phage vB_YenM_TG1]AJD81951.1 hypothetical protein YenMTG1_141 [Yersinia phage vB_YenM_TG1]CCI88715.1 hypothetical protein BN80_145 [Yersinia phage phiR1-RT]